MLQFPVYIVHIIQVVLYYATWSICEPQKAKVRAKACYYLEPVTILEAPDGQGPLHLLPELQHQQKRKMNHSLLQYTMD